VTRLVLVEHVPDAFRAEPDDVVVALTPEACYELDRRGLDYGLVTDFGIDDKLAALAPVHWQEQLSWIDTFDELIGVHVPETERWRFGAATSWGYNLKTLMDPVRIRALELDSMLDSCDRVLLHRRAEPDPPVSPRLLFQGPSVTSLVLPLVAGARGIACEEQVDEEAPPLGLPAPPSTPEQHSGLLERLKGPLRRGRQATQRVGSASTRPKARRLTLLFVDTGYDLAYLLTRAREQGHRCLLVVGDAIIEEESRSTAVIADLSAEGADTGWSSAAEAVARPDHPLWKWPNGWLADVPLADVLRPRILFWLSEVMPEVATRAASFERLLRDQSVDFVLGANIVSPDVVTAAAVTAHPVQSVLVDHGHAAIAPELFDLILLRYVHHNFCASNELADYMESRRALYTYPTAAIHVGSYQWRANTALSRSGRPPLPLPEDRPVIVYALTATAGNGQYLNNAWYTDGWYYRLCRAIVDVLARHPQLFSVVKLFPGDGLMRNPIDLYVDDLGLDHVVSSRAPLRAWIPWAERIVFDYPSTGLYEAAAAGVPYLGLLYTHHQHRPGAVSQLGPAAIHFTELDEAARAVEAFVTASNVTAPSLAPEGEEVLATLEWLARRES
jgi:hypothetical protein